MDNLTKCSKILYDKDIIDKMNQITILKKASYLILNVNMQMQMKMDIKILLYLTIIADYYPEKY